MGRKCFFISKPNRFGSVRVVRFKHYKTGNRTEPDIFLNILIGLIGFYFRFGFFGYFFSSFLDLIGISVFLLTPKLIHHVGPNLTDLCISRSHEHDPSGCSGIFS
jgi:hypothetical protein